MMSDPAGVPPTPPRGTPPLSAMVYPDVYLPEEMARTLAERANAAQTSPGALLASLIERFVQEHGGAPQDPQDSLDPPVASPETGADVDAFEDDLDAPDLVRRIVPLPEPLAAAVVRMAAVLQRSVNALIREVVQAALTNRGDVPTS